MKGDFKADLFGHSRLSANPFSATKKELCISTPAAIKSNTKKPSIQPRKIDG
ncbi:hypothetical protein HMPREF3192_00937, partial [Atopobium deltae]